MEQITKVIPQIKRSVLTYDEYLKQKVDSYNSLSGNLTGYDCKKCLNRGYFMKIINGDIVRVIAGKDKGKEGKVSSVDLKKNTVTVEGVNMHTKHTKPSAQNQNGGIVTQEGPINASNVMLVVKGQTTRVGFKVEDGKKVRIAKKTGEVID